MTLHLGEAIPQQAGPSPARIFRIGLGFQAAQVLISAVELGVFATLAPGPLTATELREALGLHQRSARDFLDSLVALRFLFRDAEGRYHNSPDATAFLDPASPDYLGAIFLGARDEYRLWGALSAALTDGRPRSAAADGGDVFGPTYSDPEKLRGFLEMMTAHNVTHARQVAQAFPWREFESFADIGCAQGALGVQLTAAHDHLTGIGFDLPAVQPVFEEFARSHGVAGRLTFQAGDFFTDPLPQADVLIFGHVLHNWGLTAKRELLARAYAAIPPGGAIVVQEAFIDDDRQQNVSGLLMSLHMLLQTSEGFDCTFAECLTWLTDAGFRDLRVVPLTPPVSLVTGRKY